MNFRKTVFAGFFAAVFMIGAVSVSAQVTQVSGRVVMKDADGKFQPVEGIKIDCYRLDVDTSCRSVNTDKRGEFVIIGLPYGSRVILGISGPGITPTVVPERNAGAKDINVEVVEGDGRGVTEQEVRESAAAASTGELTEEQKQEQAEIERKNREIADFNLKAKNTDEQRGRLNTEGKTAFEAAAAAFNGKKYAEAREQYLIAIEKFGGGYEVDPEFIGAAPGFLISKSAAERMAAKSLYFATEATKRSSIMPDLANGYGASIQSLKMAYDIAKASLDAGVPLPSVYTEARKAEIKKNLETNVADIKSRLKETFVEINSLKLHSLMFSGVEEEDAKRLDVYASCFKIAPDEMDVYGGYVIALFAWADKTYENSRYQVAINHGAAYLAKADAKHVQREAIQGLVEQYSSSLKLTAKPVN